MRSSGTGKLSPKGHVLLQTTHPCMACSPSSHAPHVDVAVTVSEVAKFMGKSSGGKRPWAEARAVSINTTSASWRVDLPTWYICRIRGGIIARTFIHSCKVLYYRCFQLLGVITLYYWRKKHYGTEQDPHTSPCWQLATPTYCKKIGGRGTAHVDYVIPF